MSYIEKNTEINHITILIISTTPCCTCVSPLQCTCQPGLFTTEVTAESLVAPTPPRMWQKASVFVE